MQSLCRTSRRWLWSSAVVWFFCISVVSGFAATIQGVVTNRTTNKPAAGDTVALVRMEQGMQVTDRATTDASGRYRLNVSDSDPVHLVRVTHQGANYFEAAPSGKNTVDVNVYDVAEHVAGVSTEADLQWLQADGNNLEVMEIYVVKNASSPPRTQFGPHPYEFYLPKDADILSSAALAPGSMPVRSAPKPAGATGRYTFDFPIRPGETHFQVRYRLPYSGSTEIHPRFASNLENVAVILPKSMQFSAKPAAAFRSVDASPNVQTYLSKNVTPVSRIAIRISGTGELPQETDSPQSGAQPSQQSPEAAARQEADNNTRPGIGLGVPLGTPSPLDKYKWWIISLVVIFLVAGAGVLMKQSSEAPSAAPSPNAGGGTMPAGVPPPVPVANIPPPDRPTELLAGLREELFRLESDRLTGRISPEEYERQKSAFEIILKRATARDSTTDADSTA